MPARADSPAGRSRLSSETVAVAALELADREGVDALSMRRLADELGVGTMTLYGYFRSKEELLDAVVDAAVGDGADLAAEGPWRDRVRAVVLTARRSMLRHPALVQIRIRQPVLRPEALRFAEALLGVLVDAGFEPHDAARSFRLLFTYVFGFAALSPAAAMEEDRASARAAIAALPAESYPSLTAAAEEAAEAMGGEEVFEFGLERILDGLEARLAG